MTPTTPIPSSTPDKAPPEPSAIAPSTATPAATRSGTPEIPAPQANAAQASAAQASAAQASAGQASAGQTGSADVGAGRVGVVEADGAVGSGAPPKRRRNRAAREREILEAAERIFGERGYQGTSMDDVAADVGVSKPLIYQYYGSKDGLFLACLARLRTHLLETVADAVMAAGDPEDALYAGFVAWFQFLDDHPQAWSVLIDEGMLNTSPAAGPAAAATDEIRAAFIELITAMVRMNLPPGRTADNDEIEIVAQSISGATERLAIWRSRIPAPPSPEKVARTLQDLLWQGLHTLSTT